MYQYSSSSERSVDENGYETVVGMFTNLIWDASLNVSQVAPYTNVLTWIEETVDRFVDRSDVRLIVKTHPAEAAHGTEQSVEEYIRTACGSLPRNVEILPSDTTVDTYELMKDVDAGVVYNTTVGLEMAYHGSPVVVGGDTHYRCLGFTHDPETKDEYLSLLGRIGDIEMTPEMQARARRYMYFLLVQKCLDFPFFSASKDATRVYPTAVGYEDVCPGNETFDLIVEKMVSGEPIVADP